MYDQSLEQLIDAVIADGVITDQERRVVLKKAAALGIDQDEVEVYLEGRLDAFKRKENAKPQKHGNVKICPNCGTPVESGAAKCSACGFAFSGIEANSSAKELDKRLREIKGTSKADNEKRAHIISSFPIPNSREDLIEFMAALEPKALTGIPLKKDCIAKAYYEKYSECVNKAELTLANDKISTIHSSRLKAYTKKIHIIYSIIALFLVGIIGWISTCSNESSKKEEALKAEYEEWKVNSLAEIDEYAAELDSMLNEIPTPTANNWELCGRMWTKATWGKTWTNSKFHDLMSDDGIHYGLEKETKKSYNEKKNQIGELIRSAHKQALIDKGMKPHEAHNSTCDEFHD